MTKQLLNSAWISRLGDFKKLFVGFSGGLDSTVLLHALVSQSTLRHKLIAVHINHGLSPNALFWQKHCEKFCQVSGIEFISKSVEFERAANIEEGARNARYAVFTSLLKAQDCMLLGHHLDDQAETVLLQLFRGAGVDGLAAMVELGCLGAGALARPLLTYSRAQLEHYAVTHELKWIEDESNQDINYSRNFLRQQVMPLLVSKWPGVVGNIARTAGHCQQARINLDELALQDSQELLSQTTSLFIEPLKSLNYERIANILRVWLKRNRVQLPSSATFQRLIHEMVFASSDALPLVSWDTVHIRRYQEYLYLIRNEDIIVSKSIEWSEFPRFLLLDDKGSRLIAEKADEGIGVPKDAQVSIKFRQGGELFSWHGQTKQLKKLFQEWGVPPWLRDRVPLVYINEQLAAVVGYAVSDLFFTRNASEAWRLILK